MPGKTTYSKAFYDDGLGDILDWIDDEILVPSETKKNRTEDRSNKKVNKRQKIKDTDTSKVSLLKSEKFKRRVNLYGDNDVDEVTRKKDETTKKAKLAIELDVNGEEVVKKVDKKLEDKARGLINRLAAQTMPFVSSEFEKLYSTHSRTEMNEVIFNNIDSSILQKSVIAKRKIVAELMLLVSYLNHKISNNIGASLVHNLIAKFESLYSSGTSDDDKTLENITFCLANLYIIGLISAHSIFEFTKRICSPEDFRNKSVELLLVVLRNIGFQLRKDNPSLMRQLILMSHEQCKILKQNTELETRLEYMIEALDAIKNNNSSKIGNYGCDIDKSTIESTLKVLIKRSKLPEALCDATYNDIVNSGNFHLLDLRIDDEDVDMRQQQDKNKAKQFIGTKKEEKICKALGLNKPTEKTIMSALLKVTDDVEASNVLIGFGMNHCSDAMVVCLHVAIHEKIYNPFYYNVISSLCKYHRKYKMATKFAIQDKIRALSGMPNQRVNILKQLCFELIKSDAIPITVLKSVEWASLDESTKEFLTYLFTSISELPEEERARIMLKSDKRSTFAGAMRTFTSCFLEDVELF